jgi:glycosyltransferase involved in cell wall biosynthesis
LTQRIADRGGRTIIVRTAILRKSALRPLGFAKLMKDAIAGIWPAVKSIRRLRPDVIIVNTIVSPLWLLAAKLTRTPAICHVHEAETVGSTLVRRGLTLPQLLADKLIVNSEFSRQVLATSWRGLARRSVVVYNAVPGPPHVTPVRPNLSGAIRLLYVGRLSPRKGPDVAIDAVTVLLERGIDVELDLVGAVFTGYEWYEHEIRERVAATGLQERVRFHGFREDIWAFVERADINLVPSTADEPFGNTAVEAALAGRPLIVSDAGGLLEASAGLRARIVVPPGSSRSIADAVETIRHRWTEYANHAMDDAAAAAGRYSTDRYAASMQAIVASVAGTRRRHNSTGASFAGTPVNRSAPKRGQ